MKQYNYYDVELDGFKARFAVDEYNKSDYIARFHQRGQFYEADILKNLPAKIEGNIVDIGTNVGNHSIFFAQKYPSSTIHSFEPNPIAQRYLCENLRTNKIENRVKVHKNGISNKNRLKVPFKTGRVSGDSPGLGAARLAQYSINEEGGRFRDNNHDVFIQLRELDSFNLKNIGLIKIDVEGHEIEVFEGAEQTIRSSKPIIMFEVWGKDEEDHLERIKEMLGPQYTLKSISKTDYLAIPIPSDKEVRGEDQTTRGPFLKEYNYELTVLIASLEARKDKLQNLLMALGDSPSVEVLVEVDNGELSIGNKRQLLLDKAKGKYVCYLDDDDMVEPDFCSRLLAHTRFDPDAIGYWVQQYSNGEKKRVKKMTLGIRESVGYKDYILQPLTHRAAIKCDIAKKFKFEDIDFGEDKAYWEHVADNVNWEKVVLIGEVLYQQYLEPGKYDQHGNHCGN